MEMQLGCCCSGNCWKKWTPRDEVLRRIRGNNATFEITEHPYDIASGMHLPMAGAPTGLVDGGYYGPNPQGCYNVDVFAYDLYKVIAFEENVPTWSPNQDYINVPIDISTDAEPTMALQPFTFDEESGDDGSSCVRSSTAGGSTPEVITKYGDPDSTVPSTDSIVDQPCTCVPNRPFTWDTKKYLHVKMAVHSGSYEIDDVPTTNAEITSGGWALVDALLVISYNSRVGDGPTSILTPDIGDYGLAPYIGDCFNLTTIADPNPDRIPIHGRTVRERMSWNSYIGFSNGDVTLNAQVDGELYSSAIRSYVQGHPQTDFTPYPGTQKPPIVQTCPAIGYPDRLTSYNNAGFPGQVMVFEADWNPDLNQYQTTSVNECIYAGFLWDAWTPQDDWPPHGTVVSVPRHEVPSNQGGSFGTHGVGGGWVNPWFDGVASYDVVYQRWGYTEPFVQTYQAPSGGGPPFVNEFTSINNAGNWHTLYKADDIAENKFKRKDPWCHPLTAQSSGGGGGGTYGWELDEGYWQARSNQGSPPHWTLAATSASAEVCREEYTP